MKETAIMADIKDILELSLQYGIASAKMSERLKLWQKEKSKLVKLTLSNIRKAIENENVFLRGRISSGEAGNSIYIKSSDLEVPTTSRKKEKGFEIHFDQLPNGKILVAAYEHSLSGDSEKHPIDLIENLEEINEELIIDEVYRGLKEVMKTTFLFMGEMKDSNRDE